jgi:hypothetical protein
VVFIKILSALSLTSVRCFVLISILLSGVISASAQSDVDANTLLLLRFENTLTGGALTCQRFDVTHSKATSHHTPKEPFALCGEDESKHVAIIIAALR